MGITKRNTIKSVERMSYPISVTFVRIRTKGLRDILHINDLIRFLDHGMVLVPGNMKFQITTVSESL